jgi:N-acetylmuramoyl-L-alanine amidase
MRRNTNYIVVHCAATPASMDIGAKEIDRWHRTQGWLKIGYHFVIRRDGTIEKGREVDDVGAHVAGYNNLSLGICLVGGLKEDKKTPEDNFTPDQKTALWGLLCELMEKYPVAAVVGHRDLNPHKECPCFDVNEFVENQRKARACVG